MFDSFLFSNYSRLKYILGMNESVPMQVYSYTSIWLRKKLPWAVVKETDVGVCAF